MVVTLFGNKAVKEALPSKVNAAISIKHNLDELNALDLGELYLVKTRDGQ
jgi:hypothetical protein